MTRTESSTPKPFASFALYRSFHQLLVYQTIVIPLQQSDKILSVHSHRITISSTLITNDKEHLLFSSCA